MQGTFSRTIICVTALLLVLPVVAFIIQTPLTSALLVYTKIGLIYQPMLITIIHLVTTLTIAMGLGVTMAWVINNYDFPFRGFFGWVQVIPLVFPAFVIGQVYEPALRLQGIHDGLRLGLYSGLANTPLVFLVMRACFYSNNAEYWYASRSIGAGPLQSLWNIGVMLNRPVVIACMLLIIMEVLSDLALPAVFDIHSLSNLDEIALPTDDLPPLVSQLALGFFLVVLVFYLLEKMLQGNRQYTQAVAGYRPIVRHQLTSTKSLYSTYLLLIVPFIFAVIVPLLLLIDNAANSEVPEISTITTPLRYSLLLALGTALLTTAFSLMLGFWHRLTPGKTGAVLIALASIGLIIPSLFLAVAIHGPALWLDSWFSPLWLSLGLEEQWLSNSIFITLYLLIVRYLGFGLLIVMAALAGLSKELHFAARSLGNTAGKSFLGIELQLIVPFTGAALLLIAMQTIKESGVALFLLPQTMPTLVSSLSTSVAENAGTGFTSPYLVLALVLSCGIMLALALLLAIIGLRK